MPEAGKRLWKRTGRSFMARKMQRNKPMGTDRGSVRYAEKAERVIPLHPENLHVKDKIRQQLQVLRDRGFLAQFERGVWAVK